MRAVEDLGGHAGLGLSEARGCRRDRVVIILVDLAKKLGKACNLMLLLRLFASRCFNDLILLDSTVKVFSFLNDVMLDEVAAGLDLLLQSRGWLRRGLREELAGLLPCWALLTHTWRDRS